MIRILFSLVLSSVTPALAAENRELQVLQPKGFCELIMSDQVAQGALSEEILDQIAGRISEGKITGRFAFVENIRVVVDQLVAENKITAGQADSLFAERILGSFSPVFLKYTIAELRSRGFKKEQMVQFILHFDQAFTPSRQIEFAIAVTRRMLLTINDDPSLKSPRGLEKFLSGAKAFGISSDSYSHFLQIWAYVRMSHPKTILHYILSNIKNSASTLNQQITAELAAQQAETDKSQEKVGLWSMIKMSWPIGPDDVRVKPTFESVAEMLMDANNIPEFIRNVNGLDLANETPPDFLTRFSNQGKTLTSDPREILDDLEELPPYALDFIVQTQLRHMNFKTLRDFSLQGEFPNLNEETKLLAAETLAKFRQFEELAKSLISAKRKLDRVREQAMRAQADRSPEIEEPDVNTNAVSYFMSSFSRSLSAKGMGYGEGYARAVSDSVNTAYLSTLKKFKKLSEDDFTSIVNKVISKIFITGYLHASVGATQALMAISHDYILSQADIGRIFTQVKSMQLYGAGKGSGPKYDIEKFEEFDNLLKPNAWGRNGSEHVMAVETTNLAEDPTIEPILMAMRDFLAREKIFLDPQEILEKFRLGFYSEWNAGVPKGDIPVLWPAAGAGGG